MDYLSEDQKLHTQVETLKKVFDELHQKNEVLEDNVVDLREKLSLKDERIKQRMDERY